MDSKNITRKILVITRSNLLSRQNSAKWNLVQNSREYKDQLFSENRLKFRLWALENLAVRSVYLARQKMIENDNTTDIRHYILTSTELPLWAKRKLETIESKSSFIKIIFCQEESAYPVSVINNITNSFLLNMGESVLCAYVWLDDDDILAEKYFQHLSGYISETYAGFMISFPNGISGFFNSTNKTYIDFRLWYKPKIALGLAYINKVYLTQQNKLAYLIEKPINIFDIESHQEIDQVAPLILDGRSIMWIRTAHDYMDSFERKNKKGKLTQNTPKANQAELEQVIKGINYPQITLAKTSALPSFENRSFFIKYKTESPKYATRRKNAILTVANYLKRFFF